MHAERDWLRDRVFPELEERLKSRFHHLEVIDLRWGVDVSGGGDDEARERTVLKVCLDEIERSRPFLIALLGQRYGWLPPQELLASAATEAGFDGYPNGASVTDLEITFGLSGNPGANQRCWFYFREPLDLSGSGPEVAARYDDRFNPMAQAAGAVQKLDALKQRIEKILPSRVRRYRCNWSAETHRPSGLEAFGKQVLEDIWSDLEHETLDFVASSAISPLEQSELNLAEFLESRARSFVGREATVESLLGFCKQSASHWALCVTGTAGSGKSSVFAELHRQLTGESELLLAHAAGIDARSTRTDNMLRSWIGKLAAELDEILVKPEEMTSQEVTNTFERLLTTVCESKHVVLLIDALDQFEDAAPLKWLPQAWPDRTRLICTSLSGPSANALLARQGVHEAPLPPLREIEAAEIIRAICARYHRRPQAAVVATLLAKTDARGQAAFGNPLWLVLATEELNLLGADDFARADTELAELKPEQRLDQIVLRRANELPAEIGSLFGEMLDRAEKLHGSAWTQAFLLATAISVAGWRERDLQLLLPEIGNEAWDPLRFAALRRTFRGHLVQRGADGRWDFMHRQLRDFAHDRRHDLDIDLAEAHLIAGSYLMDLPDEDSIKQAGIMRHLIHSKVPYAPGTYLAHHAQDSANFRPSLEALTEYLGSFDSDENMGRWFERCLLEKPNEQTDNASMLCQIIAFDGPRGIFAPLRLSAQRTVLQVLTRIMDQETEGRSGTELNVNMRSDLAKCLGELARIENELGNNDEAARIARRALDMQEALGEFRTDVLIEQHLTLGEQLRQQGDLPAAAMEFRKALPLAEALLQHDSNLSEAFEARAAHLLARVHLHLADVLVASDLAGSERSALLALQMAESWRKRRPDSPGWPHVQAAAEEKLGNVHFALGRYDLAEQRYRSSFQTVEQLSDRDPLDATLRQHLVTEGMKWATSLHALGRSDEAFDRFLNTLTLGDALIAANPSDVSWIRQMALGRRDAAKLAFEMRRMEDALDQFQRVCSLARELPQNARIDEQIRSNGVLGLVQTYEAMGDREHAIETARGYIATLRASGPVEMLNPYLQGEAAVAHDMLGRSLARIGDYEAALRQFEAGAEACAVCARRNDAQHAAWQLNRAQALRSSVEILQALGRIEDVFDKLRQSVEIRLDYLSDTTPDDGLMQIGDDLRWLATTHMRRGERAQARELLQRSIDIETRRVSLAPASVEPAAALAKSCESMGRLLSDAQEHGAAMSAFEHGADALAAHLPQGVRGEILYQHSVCLEGVGVCLEQLARYDEALAQFFRVLAARKELVRSQPDERTWAAGLMVSLLNVADSSVRVGLVDQAADYAEQCRQLVVTSARAGGRPDGALAEALSQLEAKIADLKSSKK